MTSAKKLGIILMCLAVAAVLAGTTACQKEAAESEDVSAKMEFKEYEGTVMTALGRYMYLPSAQGFDIVLQGFDAASLVGKEVRVKGELLIEHPSIFQADTVEVKDDAGNYTTVFTRAEEFQMEDFVEVKAREAFEVLAITGVNKPEEWEGKGQGKVFGKLQESFIILSDDRGREIGRIVVDDFTTYAKYYMQKLRLFDSFWFYLNIKDTVERRARTRTKQLFNAEVVYAGLY